LGDAGGASAKYRGDRKKTLLDSRSARCGVNAAMDIEIVEAEIEP
jgi:hypothetical protein